MKIKTPFLTPATINILSIAIVACAIFVVDTQVHVDIDVPVLYVAVVLMSTRLFEGRGLRPPSQVEALAGSTAQKAANEDDPGFYPLRVIYGAATLTAQSRWS